MICTWFKATKSTANTYEIQLPTAHTTTYYNLSRMSLVTSSSSVDASGNISQGWANVYKTTSSVYVRILANRSYGFITIGY